MKYIVCMRIELKSPSNYENDYVLLDIEFKNSNKFKRFSKKLTNHLNNKNRKFVTVGFKSDAYTLRIEDIEDISYIIERI